MMKTGNVLVSFLVIGIISSLFVYRMSTQNDEKNPITSSPTPTQAKQQQVVLGNQTEAPDIFLEDEKKYTVTLETSYGDIDIELFHTEVPIAANNFAYLAKTGFYNSTTFHRVIKGFMIQGGDPRGDGTGGPGYQFEDEEITRSYDRGIVAYANSGPDTNGSQFFIMHEDYPLQPAYVIFGKVVKGMDVVDQIANAPVEANAYGEASEPVSTISIDRATLSED